MVHPSVRERTATPPAKTEQKGGKDDPSVSSGIGFDHGIPTVGSKARAPRQQADSVRPVHPAVQVPAPKPQQMPQPVAPHRARPAITRTQQDVQRHAKADSRFQHELQEMRETDDLREVDDDVEDVSTLFQWRAVEHNHQPKSATWYMVLAASITVISVGMAFFGNIIGAITIAFVGGLVYYVAQKDPDVFRYRLMTEGVAFNDTLYHYRDLDAFNIVYEPGATKTVLLRSKRTFAPLLHMEIGEADPVHIRDILIEFVDEDQDLTEPLVDILAQRLGF